MQLLISGRNFKVSEELREHIDRRLQFALDKFDQEIDRIEVGLSDVNGPKGGIDKHCRLVAKTRAFGIVVIEDTDGDFYTVVSRAADRLGHSIGRTLDKKRNFKGARRRSVAPDVEEGEER